MTQKDDLISRQAAIDALRKHEINLPIFTPRETDVFWDDAIDCCVSVLERLPSAEKRTNKRTETHECDLISRKSAIDALTHEWDGMVTSVFDVVKSLPSAEPEMIREIRKWINSSNRGNADYFIVDKIEEIINRYE